MAIQDILKLRSQSIFNQPPNEEFGVNKFSPLLGQESSAPIGQPTPAMLQQIGDTIQPPIQANPSMQPGVANKDPFWSQYIPNAVTVPDQSRADNPMTQLRFPLGEEEVPQETSPGVESLEDRYKRVSSIYTPQTTHMDKLTELLNSVPERKPPSFLRALVAAGLSLKAQDPAKTSEEVMQRPYMRDLEAWKEQADATYKGAQLENTSNVNERTLIGNLLNAEKAERIAIETERYNRERAATARINADANARRAEGWDIVEAGGRFIAVSPPDAQNPNGRYKDMGSTGEMGADALEQFRANNRIEVARMIGGILYNDATGMPVIVNARDRDPRATPVAGAQGPFSRPGSTSKVQGMEPAALEKIRATTQGTLAALELVVNSEKRTIQPDVQSVIGLRRAEPTQWLWGGKGRGANQKIESLKALLIINLIAEMKAQSRTGATGFGQLTGRELDVLENAASRINATDSDKDFINAVMDVKTHLDKIMKPGPDEPGGIVTTPTQRTDIQNRAVAYLENYNRNLKPGVKPMPITPANIDYAIKSGRVK